MSPEFRSLLMKEWSERRRLFLAGIGLMLLYLGYDIAYEIEHRTRAFVASYYTTCSMFSMLGAVLLAMTTATGEYTQRTLRFSASLPVSLKKVAWARLLGGWACLIAPIVMGALLVTLLLASGFFEQAIPRPADYSSGSGERLIDRPSLTRIEAIGFLWTTTAISVAVAIHLLTLITLLGTTCRSEGTVGFLGAIVVLLSTGFTTIRHTLKSSGLETAADWIGGLHPEALAISWGYGEMDGASYSDLEVAPLIWGPLAVSCVITLLLGGWFARRYGRQPDFATRPRTVRLWRFLPSGPRLVSRLGVRWPGRLSALVWLNARQSVPLCLTGLTFAVLITCLTIAESPRYGAVTDQLAGELPSSTWFTGMMWGAIVAVAVFTSELKPDLEQFWRSRPISPSAWFWTKFAVGLAALLITLDLIPACVSWASSQQNEMVRVGVAYAACIPALHTLVYSLAVAAVCRIRKPIPAAMLALMMFFALDQILDSIPVYPKLSTLNVYNRLQSLEFNVKNPGESLPIDLTTGGYPLVYGFVAMVIVGAALFARRNAISHIADKAVLIVIGLTILCVPAARADDPALIKQISDGIRRRESLINTRLLRWTLRTHTSIEFGKSVAAQIAAQKPRRGPAPGPVTAHDEVTSFLYFDRPPARAWKEFNADGALRYFTAFDGAIERTYRADSSGRDLSNGSVSAVSHISRQPSDMPEKILTVFNSWTSLTELINTVPLGSVVRREVAGENYIDVKASRTLADQRDRRSPNSYEHRYQITLNASRDYWPVHVTYEVVQHPGELILSRTITTATGWIDAGPIAYPKTVVQKIYMKPSDRPEASDDLVEGMTRTYDIESAAINSEIPDAAFAPRFPPNSRYHDSRDIRWYEVDSAGEPHPYIPKPKGLRGAVFTYHLIWMSLACIYLLRRSVAQAFKPV